MPRHLRGLLCAVIAAVWSAGAGSLPLRAGSSQSRDTATWNVTLAVTGGFAGLHREIEASSTGKVTATDRRPIRQVVEQLSPNELTKLTALVEAAAANDVTRSRGCADCLVYDLTLQRGATRIVARVDDGTLPGSGLNRLIEALRDLQTRLLAR